MFKKLGLSLNTLPAQMILSFITLVLLTAAAAGIPAILVVRGQLDRQAWAQLEQGRRATDALYEAKKNEVAALAILTAQRPTLRRLAVEGDPSSLSSYLNTLQAGAGLDLVLLCDPDHRVMSQTSLQVTENVCAGELPNGFLLLSEDAVPSIWLLAAHPIEENTSIRSPATVVVGVQLTDRFALQIQAQTGLEHSLLANGECLATSLPGQRSQPSAPTRTHGSMILNGEPYYYDHSSLSGSGSDTPLISEVALPVAGIASTQRRLASVLIGGILAVAALASLLGIVLARRIGRPLENLANAATALSSGDLSSPLRIEAQVREVALVAHALEGARTELELSLAELQQEKAWRDHLLEAIVEGIVTLDHHGRITFFSQGAEHITGQKRDQVLGQVCDSVLHPDETDLLFSELVPPPGQRRKIAIERHDGRQVILAVTGARLLPSESGDARVALVFRDISEEEAVHRLLGHFLANVAHEFRTPLSSLAASVELLMDQAPDLSPAELRELLTAVHLGVLGLQTLVDNLLEGASIEAGRFQVFPRPANLGEIIAEAIRMMQPLLDKHGQQLVVELPAATPMVQADPRRTVQVLVNLLSNASKYGPDDSEIAINAALEGKWLRIRVTDQGVGVPPEQQANLFQRFVRSGTSDQKAQYGAGLGLSVVKAIVEAQGGRVGVDGATFWFTVPKA